MVRVKQAGLGHLGRTGVGDMVGDIFNIVSGVTGVVGTAINGQAGGGSQLTAAQIQAQQAAAAAKAKEEESRRTWTYVGIGAGILVIGGGLLYMAKNK